MHRTQIDNYSPQWPSIEHRIQVATGKSSIKMLNVHKYQNQQQMKGNHYESIVNITDFNKQYIRRVQDKTIPIQDVIFYCGHINIYQPQQPSKIYSILLCKSQLGIIAMPSSNASIYDSTYIEPENDEDLFQYNFLLKTHQQYQIQYEVTFVFNDEQQFRLNQYQCSNCQNRIPGVYCKTEHLLFCDECCNRHHQTKLMQTHQLELINKINILEHCKNHNEKQQYYCMKCQKYLCLNCIQKGVHHNNHQHPVKLISYLYEQSRQIIQILPKKHHQKVTNLLKSLQVRKTQINDNHEQIKRYLNTNYNNSIQQLNHITQSKLKLLISTEVQLKIIHDKLQWVKAFVKFQEKNNKPKYYFNSVQKFQMDFQKIQIADFQVIFTTKPDTVAEAEIVVGQRNEIERTKQIKHKTQPINTYLKENGLQSGDKSRISNNTLSPSGNMTSQNKSEIYSYNENVNKPHQGELYLLLQNSNLNFFKVC